MKTEDWHRILKSGCRAEFLGHRDGDRIRHATPIKAAVVWPLLPAVVAEHETPELSAEILHYDIEIKILEDFAEERKLPPPEMKIVLCGYTVLPPYCPRLNPI